MQLTTNQALIAYGTGIGWAVAGWYSQMILMMGWFVLGLLALWFTITGK